MTLNRRDFLKASASLAAVSVGSAGCLSSASRTGLARTADVAPPFLHGVASGDPLADRVILWTRVTPPPGLHEGFDVRFEVASDPGMRSIVSKGRVVARASSDYTIKVDPASLAPGRSYFYRFDALGEASPVGRTRTLPEGRVDRLRFGVASCANYPQGYFNAYSSLAQRGDLDAVLHLGDYLYEYGRDGYGGDAGLGRDVDPAHEILSLADYRARYAQYRSDPDLQSVHLQHPFIAIWDDHEIANNSWRDGAANHQPETEGDYAARRAAAVRAYFEWMPIRESTPGRIYRSFRFGDLADLVMLDTRIIGRDAIAANGDRATALDPGRSILGDTQAAWLERELSASKQAGTAWRVLGQQVMLASHSRPEDRMNPDAWDGYRASRSRLLSNLGPGRVPDVVTLTGDYHSSWAMDVAPDPFASSYRPDSGSGAVSVEFVAPAISSEPLGATPGLPESFASDAQQLPHVRWIDVEHNGYLLLDIDRERSQGEWYFERDVTRPVPDEHFGAAFATARGASRLEAVERSPGSLA